MFYLSKLIILTNKGISDNVAGSHETVQDSDHVTISLLLIKMCNIAKYESSQTPKLTQKVGIFTILAWHMMTLVNLRIIFPLNAVCRRYSGSLS